MRLSISQTKLQFLFDHPVQFHNPNTLANSSVDIFLGVSRENTVVLSRKKATCHTWTIKHNTLTKRGINSDGP